MAKHSEQSKAKKEVRAKRHDAKMQAREEGTKTAGSHKNKSNKKGKALPSFPNTKSGCLPKLFMLILPFIAVGGYLFIRS